MIEPNRTWTWTEIWWTEPEPDQKFGSIGTLIVGLVGWNYLAKTNLNDGWNWVKLFFKPKQIDLNIYCIIVLLKKYLVTISIGWDHHFFFQKYFHPPTIFVRVVHIFLACPLILQADIRKLKPVLWPKTGLGW